VYRSRLTDNMAQLAVIHISNNFRKMGIGKRLSEKIIEKTKADGKNKIYVTSSSSIATVDFYKKLGFKLAQQVNSELFEFEPDDIHMIMNLAQING
jgi:ribosomal protein S18 acetylase RimI-like enzyme